MEKEVKDSESSPPIWINQRGRGSTTQSVVSAWLNKLIRLSRCFRTPDPSIIAASHILAFFVFFFFFPSFHSKLAAFFLYKSAHVYIFSRRSNNSRGVREGQKRFAEKSPRVSIHPRANCVLLFLFFHLPTFFSTDTRNSSKCHRLESRFRKYIARISCKRDQRGEGARERERGSS